MTKLFYKSTTGFAVGLLSNIFKVSRVLSHCTSETAKSKQRLLIGQTDIRGIFLIMEKQIKELRAMNKELGKKISKAQQVFEECNELITKCREELLSSLLKKYPFKVEREDGKIFVATLEGWPYTLHISMYTGNVKISPIAKHDYSNGPAPDCSDLMHYFPRKLDWYPSFIEGIPGGKETVLNFIDDFAKAHAYICTV